MRMVAALTALRRFALAVLTQRREFR